MGSGGFLNANLAEYHMAVNADIGDYSVGFTDKPDHLVNPNEHVPLAEQRAQFSVRLGDLRALFVAA
jgi:CO/xanthine dehydrogenase Mo-binding subunit